MSIHTGRLAKALYVCGFNTTTWPDTVEEPVQHMVERGYVTVETFRQIQAMYPHLTAWCAQAWGCSPQAVVSRLALRQVVPEEVLAFFTAQQHLVAGQIQE